jgi:predicted glycogen debranching enzyme
MGSVYSMGSSGYPLYTMHTQTESNSVNSLPIWTASFHFGEPIPPEGDDGKGVGFGFDTEWVIPDGLGGFAMGSISGVPMRRYHGLLTSSLSSPVRRMMMLTALDEYIHIPRGGTCGTDLDIRLTGFQFADQDPPTQNPYLTEFIKDSQSCRWIYSIPTQLGPVRIRKSLTIADAVGGCRVEYEIDSSLSTDADCEDGDQDITLEIRPLIAMRDFHELNHPGSIAIESFKINPIEEPAVSGAAVTRDGIDSTLSIRGIQIHWHESPIIWRNISYHHDSQRGQENVEDLYGPGMFAVKLAPNAAHALSIEATTTESPTTDWARCSTTKHARIRSSIDEALNSAGNPHNPKLREAIARLAQAGDDFVVRRESFTESSTSVLAGYPWFSDWGRDTMIALPGLFLTTGRYDQAHQTLTTFAGAIEQGLIPNRFDDAGGSSHYNTVDASLWFVHACWQWSNATGKALNAGLIGACDEIINSYISGTIHGIGLDDTDGLIYAGDANTQLTWMDALRDGVAFTPRHGKAIEINALWINALESRLRMDGTRNDLEKRAFQARNSIVSRMTQGPAGGLVDCLSREHGVRTTRWISSPELRPNQCLAVSLPYVNLPDSVAQASLSAVTKSLLTPTGMRTLDPRDPNYCSHYTGSMTDRDRAYHNGTVWPWLLGPYCEALLRANKFDEGSRKKAQAIMLGLVSKMSSDSVGQLSEIYDAETGSSGQQQPQGCTAQAWSISEALRVLVLSCHPH